MHGAAKGLGANLAEYRDVDAIAGRQLHVGWYGRQNNHLLLVATLDDSVDPDAPSLRTVLLVHDTDKNVGPRFCVQRSNGRFQEASRQPPYAKALARFSTVELRSKQPR